MRCATCQAENRAGAKFCEECGAKLETACPACGAAVPAGKRFCGECGGPLTGASPPGAAVASGGVSAQFASPEAYTPPHLAERILRDRTALTGERKQVTVLFADVSGFTSLSERLDPEDVHALINRAFELMLGEIHRYEGTVNQFLGDGLMALFGAPVALEDHAQRAAHAALGMQRALARYHDELLESRGIDFSVRFGLNTGLVVVGAIGDNLRMDYTAVGDTTNTAARMQQLAEPGRIAVAQATERLVAPFFELRPLGTFAVKNRARPVAAYELARARPRVSRLAARASRGLSPLVGRDDALAALERAFAAARGGRGQVVFVVGDAGMGKSRLLLELRERLGDAVTWLEGDCVSYGQSTPFLPIVEMLRRNFGVEDQDSEREVIAKIDRGLRFLGQDAAGLAPYLRYLLSVDPGDPAVARLDAVERRGRVVEAIQRLTAGGSRRRPIALVVEDAHWIDRPSEDYLRELIEALPGLAVLLVLTYRPGYDQPFGERTYFWRVVLQPLDDEGAGRIVRATLGVDDLPGELAGVVARKAEGNPFFLEELGRTLVETGAVRREGGRLVAAATSSLVVPDTVQDVIAARIDRLEDRQKRTVQTASVIGREFALGLLQRVADVREALERSLADLKRVEMIYEKGLYGEREYVFRHALTQDVAYASLLQAERRRLHARTGAAIEEVYAGRLEERVEELVHHFTQGERWEKVAQYAREAAERAVALCADDRAVDFFETALAALAKLPETEATARSGVDVRLALRAPLWRAGHPDRLFQLVEEAEALATRYGLQDRLDTIYSFLVQYHWAKGDQAQAMAYGRRCLETAAAGGDLTLKVTGLLYIAHACNALGAYAEAVARSRELMALLQGPRATERFGLSGLPYAGACAQAAVCLAELGDHAGALDLVREGERVANEADHLYSKMLLAQARGEVLTTAGRPAEAIAVLEPAAAICRDKKFVGQLINSLRHLGRACVAAGRPADALAPVHESIQLQETAKVYVSRSSQHTTLAMAHLALGQLDHAEADVLAALDFAERLGERGYAGWAKLVQGEIAARRGDRRAAAEHVDEAQEIAEELAMMPLVERCRATLRALG